LDTHSKDTSEEPFAVRNPKTNDTFNIAPMFYSNRFGGRICSFSGIMTSLLSNLVALWPSILPMESFGAMSFPSGSNCRCFPGDKCWPSSSAWAHFNSSVDGNLVASVPIAAVCHDYHTSSSSVSTYDVSKCQNLQNNWFQPDVHLKSSSSAMGAPIFTNNSCNPFLPREIECDLGNYVSFSVDAKQPMHVQKTIDFANQYNIRFVIRNSGHDYNGKSIGAGALAVWTHSFKSTTLIQSYKSKSYCGRAVKVGSGVDVLEAYKFADQVKGTIVGGACPTVALAGGYTQGGGHGPLAGKFGLAADQVLEWEVMTANGKLITASKDSNQDLYWALCGGGGGTYGVVISMTVKLHEPLFQIATASVSFAQPTTTTGETDFWDAITVFVKSVPEMADSSLEVIWTVLPGYFLVSPATAPGLSREALDGLFQPLVSQLEKRKMQYSYDSKAHTSFLQSYSATFLPSSNVSNSIIGSRMIPRSILKDKLPGFVSAIKGIVASNFIFTGLTLDVSAQDSSLVSANPYWRKTVVLGTLGTYFDYQNFSANFVNQDLMTKKLIPSLAALTPNGGAYLNEADFQQPDWQAVFYGGHYQKLDAIKMKYDPHDLFYAQGAVGSARWNQEKDGRLCKGKMTRRNNARLI
jgi:hypothetical protein